MVLTLRKMKNIIIYMHWHLVALVLLDAVYFQYIIRLRISCLFYNLFLFDRSFKPDKVCGVSEYFGIERFVKFPLESVHRS